MAEKNLAVFGIKNVKTAKLGTGGEWGEVYPLKYAKSLSLPTKTSEQPIYADDDLQLSILADNGYEGNLNFTARDEELEEDLGFIDKSVIEGATADIKVDSYQKRPIYFESTAILKDSGKKYVIKNWLFGVIIKKPQNSTTTKADNITLEDVSYPITVTGELVKKADGTTVMQNADGMETVVRILSKIPTDTDYATFGDTVPDLKAAE